MALKSTNLVIQGAPLPPTFKGSPQEFYAELIRRLKIVSPTGTNFIFIGDNEPTSNVGPWLKNGTQWWVFSNELKRYVPLDISASETRWYWIGASTPTSTPPQVWLLTTKDATDQDPSHGEPVGWYVFDGSAWVPFIGVVTSGTTAERPPTPADFQQFYDTDIGVLIWWERGAWRTVSGVPGDVKFVIYEKASEALTFNPGWVLFGATNSEFRARQIGSASQDAAGSETVLPTPSGVPARGALETINPLYVLAGGTSAVPQIFLWALVKE
jgi:hypothetical protein